MQKKYWYLIISNALLRLILLIFLGYHLISNDWLWTFFTLMMFIVSIIPSLLRRFLGINLPLLFEFFITLALLFHLGNGLLNESICIDIYNKFTHFFSAIVVAFLSLIVLYVVHEYEGDIANNTKKVLFDIIIITIALGVVWEVAEWATDVIFGLTSQVDLDDTMLDMIANTLGGICMSIIGYILIKRGVLHRISKDIKNQLDDLIMKHHSP